jgi:hypothetical protein
LQLLPTPRCGRYHGKDVHTLIDPSDSRGPGIDSIHKISIHKVRGSCHAPFTGYLLLFDDSFKSVSALNTTSRDDPMSAAMAIQSVAI